MVEWTHVGMEDRLARIYARLILHDFTIGITDDDKARWVELATDIHKNPGKRNGRGKKQIYYNVRASILERGVQELTGWHHNDGYDQNDRNSYNHDLYNGKHKFEVKRWKDSYWSWGLNPNGRKETQTLFNNKDLIDYVICGDYKFDTSVPGEETRVDLTYRMICRAPSCQLFETNSRSPDTWYYDHIVAGSHERMKLQDEILVDQGKEPKYQHLNGPQAIYRKLKD